MPMMQMRPKLPHRQETSPIDGKADPPTSKLRHRIKKRDNQTMGLAQGSGSPKASCNASNRSMSSWRHQISPRTVAATPYLRVHTSDSLAKKLATQKATLCDWTHIEAQSKKRGQLICLLNDNHVPPSIIVAISPFTCNLHAADAADQPALPKVYCTPEGKSGNGVALEKVCRGFQRFNSSTCVPCLLTLNFVYLCVCKAIRRPRGFQCMTHSRANIKTLSPMTQSNNSTSVI